MRLLVLSDRDIRQVLTSAACAAAMREILLARARGDAFQPLRSVHAPPGAPGLIAVMPAHAGRLGFGLKALCLMPGNPARGLDAHLGIVLISSPDTGEPLAILNASAVTEIRTAVVSGLATELLARPDADVLAIIGTGVQAAAHLRVIAAGRPLAQVRVAGRGPGSAARFADRIGRELITPPEVVACDSARDALAGAGIVVTATSSAEPVLRREWLADGAHINAVGACLPGHRELDSATMASAAIYADARESLLAETGDYLIPAAAGLLGPDRIRAEIGDLISEPTRYGRADQAELTVFKSLGLAIEDLAAGFAAYRAAREAGIGAWADF